MFLTESHTMSMLKSFYGKIPVLNKCLNASPCLSKTLLEKTIKELMLLIKTKENQLTIIRREIAKLLGIGKENDARIQAKHFILQTKRKLTLVIVLGFCKHIAGNLPAIQWLRECPPDLKGAVSSICFAASRCDDLPSLLKIQSQFSIKYGKEFISAAIELKQDCGVDGQIIEELSISAPSDQELNRLLKEIAVEYKIDWDLVSADEDVISNWDDMQIG